MRAVGLRVNEEGEGDAVQNHRTQQLGMGLSFSLLSHTMPTLSDNAMGSTGLVAIPTQVTIPEDNGCLLTTLHPIAANTQTPPQTHHMYRGQDHP